MAELVQPGGEPTLGDHSWAKVEHRSESMLVHLGGFWDMEQSSDLEALCAAVRPSAQPVAIIDLEGVARLDTTGAWLLHKLNQRLSRGGMQTEFQSVSPSQRSLIDQVATLDASAEIEPPQRNSFISRLEKLGVTAENAIISFGELLSFLGLVLARFLRSLRQPDQFRAIPLVNQMEQVGLNAVPIVGLISFLIGAVMVNQGAIQLQKLGGEVFVVDLIGFAHLRELGVLLTAIIAAGRSGSAFAAQIGSMKLNEEVDALRTLGLDPIDTLVIPRMLALIVMMPLLTFYADLMGLLGGGLMAWTTLNIEPENFITRLSDAVGLWDFLTGLIKAVVFGGVIAVSGCFHGLSVGSGAEAVGQKTTLAVVQSIFLIIVLDAFFAVFFTFIGI